MGSRSDLQVEVEPLTGRQREVLAMIARGYTNPQIADALGVTIDGAKWHVREIMSKLGVDSREEAGEWWRRERSVSRKLGRAIRGLVAAPWGRVAAWGSVAAVGVVVAVAIVAGVVSGDGEADVVVNPTRGAEQVGSPCGSQVAEWLCDAASALSSQVEQRQLGAIINGGTRTTYTCGDGVLPGAEYSFLCQRAVSGEQRQGYPVAMHGSHGGPMDVDMLQKQISQWLGLEGEPVAPMASIGCPVADAECRTFMVVFPVTGGRVMYLAFAGGPTVRPSLIGAGGSGDNADTLLRGGETNSVLGVATFWPVDSAKVLAMRTPTPMPTAAPTAVVQPAGTITGVAELDALIPVILDPHEAGIAQVLAYPSYECEEPRPIQPQPLVCREGQEPGDALTGVWVAHVEAGLWAPEIAPAALTNVLMQQPSGLFAAFHRTAPQLGRLIVGEYGLILSKSTAYGPEYTTLHVTDGRIIGVEFSFPPLEFADPAVEWVVPPPGMDVRGAAQVRIPGDCLNVRAEAWLGGALVGCVADGVLVEVMGGVVEADGVEWKRVRLPGGDEGWVSGAYLVE